MWRADAECWSTCDCRSSWVLMVCWCCGIVVLDGQGRSNWKITRTQAVDAQLKQYGIILWLSYVLCVALVQVTVFTDIHHLAVQQYILPFWLMVECSRVEALGGCCVASVDWHPVVWCAWSRWARMLLCCCPIQHYYYVVRGAIRIRGWKSGTLSLDRNQLEQDYTSWYQ